MNWQRFVDLAAAATTACATAATALMMVAQARRDRRGRLPLVELHIIENPQWGCFELEFVLRNQGAETLRFEAATLRRPRRATISDEMIYASGGARGYRDGGRRHLSLSAHAGPVGSAPVYVGPVPISDDRDVAKVRLGLLPAADWRGGRLVIAVAIAETTFNARQSRIIMKRHITADAASRVLATAT